MSSTYHSQQNCRQIAKRPAKPTRFWIGLVTMLLAAVLVVLPAAATRAQWYDSYANTGLGRSDALDEYWEERIGPDRFDEGLEEELTGEFGEAELWEEMEAPSMYYDTTQQDREFLGGDYGYPYTLSHPHSPVFAEENPGIGGSPYRYYADDWFEEDGLASDQWYYDGDLDDEFDDELDYDLDDALLDDLDDDVYDYHERDYLDRDGDIDTGYEDFEYDEDSSWDVDDDAWEYVDEYDEY